jgi:siroheme synthase-like protein
MDSQGNLLFPVFLRLDQLRLLVVGGGAVGTEKTMAIFNSSPNAHVRLVAPEIRAEIKTLASSGVDLKLYYKPFEESDLEGIDLVIIATSNHELNLSVREATRRRGIITNVADTPNECDFYLGSIVKKGDLKIAISTNGKSPTFAKRIREMFEEILPSGIQEILDNLTKIREKLKGDFEYKVQKLNEITNIEKEKS